MTNLALGKPALQSSTSEWSSSRNPEQDARGANNGKIARDHGFHTATEREPWWQVDLCDEFLIRRVVLFNRQHCAERLMHFSLLKSLDGHNWETFFRKRDDAVFGAHDDVPYVLDVSDDHFARFVRVRLDGVDCLHFNECQIFGERLDPAKRKSLMEGSVRAAQERQAIPDGRNGEIINIDGFFIFSDNENYDRSILTALKDDSYEGQERALVKSLVRPGDRIIEAGTALGVVSMTAASIVGAENVLTFDANPYILSDAQQNFRRNGLQGIKSCIGVLKNRRSFVDNNEMVSFHISKAFWASRLIADRDAQDIIREVRVPTFCLEDEIDSHQANVLICDIEGGEAELLMNSNLSGIKLIIMETHYWAAGEARIDSMVRQLYVDGFAIHLRHSGNEVLVLRR